MNTGQNKTTGSSDRTHLYSCDYFLSDCDGHIEFKNSKGKILGKRLKRIIALANVVPDAKILDVGCGRGELVLHGFRRGANAYGIDTSDAALNICRQTLNLWARDFPRIRSRTHFLKADGVRLPFKACSFDVVIFSDILEHLHSPQQRSVLQEARRILKRNGKTVIHTSPQKYFIPATGRIFSMTSRILRCFVGSRKEKQRIIPWNVRPLLPRGLQKDIHVNELSRCGLVRKVRKAGFRIRRIWLEPNPHYINFFFSDRRALKMIRAFRTIIPINHLFYSELYAVAEAIPTKISPFDNQNSI